LVALGEAAITDADIEAGRFAGAEVGGWLVNWADPAQRWRQLRGSIGELKRSGSAFRAELRGLTDVLNAPMGRVYQKPCSAVLSDGDCRFDLEAPGYATEIAVEQVLDRGVFAWAELDDFTDRWFAPGRLTVLSGAAKGLWSAIKADRILPGQREIHLWTPLHAPVAPGDMVRLTAGCDKRAETCRLKFNNFLNFQGFPDIPGEDWMMAYPRSGNPNTGGSRR